MQAHENTYTTIPIKYIRQSITSKRQYTESKYKQSNKICSVSWVQTRDIKQEVQADETKSSKDTESKYSKQVDMYEPERDIHIIYTLTEKSVRQNREASCAGEYHKQVSE